MNYKLKKKKQKKLEAANSNLTRFKTNITITYNLTINTNIVLYISNHLVLLVISKNMRLNFSCIKEF